MKQADVKLLQEYETRVCESLVRVRVKYVMERPTRSGRAQRVYQCQRVDTGAVLPKWRTAAALRTAGTPTQLVRP